jgi:hypothetical protein
LLGRSHLIHTPALFSYSYFSVKVSCFFPRASLWPSSFSRLPSSWDHWYVLSHQACSFQYHFANFLPGLTWTSVLPIVTFQVWAASHGLFIFLLSKVFYPSPPLYLQSSSHLQDQ